MEISDKQFEQLINAAMDELPQEYIERLDNVAITFDDDPSPSQRKELKLRCHDTLLGLYEGIPLTKRNAGYSMVLPDKITLFKDPIVQLSTDVASLKQQIKHTLWHEIAHYYGLDHDRIHEIEQRHREKSH